MKEKVIDDNIIPKLYAALWAFSLTMGLENLLEYCLDEISKPVNNLYLLFFAFIFLLGENSISFYDLYRKPREFLYTGKLFWPLAKLFALIFLIFFGGLFYFVIPNHLTLVLLIGLLALYKYVSSQLFNQIENFIARKRVPFVTSNELLT